MKKKFDFVRVINNNAVAGGDFSWTKLVKKVFKKYKNLLKLKEIKNEKDLYQRHPARC